MSELNGGALLVIAGLWTRVAAVALALFSIASAVLFHGNFANQVDQIMFMKNFAIAGGFLILPRSACVLVSGSYVHYGSGCTPPAGSMDSLAARRRSVSTAARPPAMRAK